MAEVKKTIIYEEDDSVGERDEIYSTIRAPRRYSVLYAILNIVEVLLGLRFLFRLFGANASNALVNGLYQLTSPLVAPFRGIFETTTASGATFEWATLLAMLVYALIVSAIVAVTRPTNVRAY